jgi:hypothetical protein
MGDGFDREEVRGDLKQNNTQGGGRIAGGGPDQADMGAGGGSSGSGGYGRDQHFENQQAQGQGERSEAADPGQSRGERLDEQANGGRGEGSVSFDRSRDGDEFGADQRAHQDRGQSEAEEEV